MIRNSAFALAALTLACAAHAGTYAITGSFDANPAVNVLTGSFSFDDSEVANGGADGDFTLTALSFTFLGETYLLTDATDPYVKFENGSLTGPNGNFTTPGGGTLDLFSFFGSSNFNYAINGNEQGGTLSFATVPEPASYALVLAALGGAGWFSRRRKAA